jgi:hypothetical protein
MLTPVSGAAAAGEVRQVRQVRSLGELAELLAAWSDECGLYVRWSPDAGRDMDREGSKDELTDVPLPGLSANSLLVEPWWGERALEVWVARRLYDYRHLVELRGPGTRPWVLSGTEVGRGPDNEPLVQQCRLVAEIDERVIDEAVEVIESMPAEWGSLRRS